MKVPAPRGATTNQTPPQLPLYLIGHQERYSGLLPCHSGLNKSVMTLRETLIEEILHQPEEVLYRMRMYMHSLSPAPAAPKASHWPAGYFDQVLGTLPDDDPWEEPPEMPFEPEEH